MVSFFEISKKISIGKLKLKENTSKLIDKCKKHWNIKNSFTKKKLQIYENLPLHHRYPFDLILIAQAKVKNMTIIIMDRNFKKYDIDIFSF